MALPLSMPFPQPSSSQSRDLHRSSPPSSVLCIRSTHHHLGSRNPRRTARTTLFLIPSAIERKGREETTADSESLIGEPTSSEKTSREEEASKLGEEIRRVLKEGEKGEKKKVNGFLGGVAEEIGEIEWPVFGKVVGTTGVVLGVIAGSSVVLLTVNAILAELSDRVFAGRGVQDFFG